jgi:hypothetical protein
MVASFRAAEGKAMTRRDAFRVGDRVELMLFYSLVDEPRPQGTVVSVDRTIHCKMDRNGKVVRLEPSDLRVIRKPPVTRGERR